MPELETVPIKATLIVEVGTHRLEFTESAKVTGCYGLDDGDSDCLERLIRDAIDSAIFKTHYQAMGFARKAWAPTAVETPHD
jgi:hypothetical protein